MYIDSHPILLNSNAVQSEDVEHSIRCSLGRHVRNSVNTITSLPLQDYPETSTGKSLLDDRTIRIISDRSLSESAPVLNQISITDSGETFDLETLWEDIEYYLQRLINVSPDHLEQAKQYLPHLGTDCFEYYEDLMDYLVLWLNEKEGTDYPLMDEVGQDNSHFAGRNREISDKVWDLCKYMTTALAADSVMSGVISSAAAIPLNSTFLGSAIKPTTRFEFIAGTGFDHVSNHPTIRGLPDICAKRKATGRKIFGLVNGETICIPDGDHNHRYQIGLSGSKKSIAVSTGHGRGDLKLEVKNGRVSGVSDQPGTNTECVVIENPQGFWTEIRVKGNKDKASLAVDFDTDTCRIPIRKGFTDKVDTRTEGYPFKSAHLLVYEVEFSDAKLNWPGLTKDLDDVQKYFKHQSYGIFDVTREVVKVKLGESIEQYDNAEWTEWQDRYYGIVTDSGVNPKQPGGNRIVLMIAPYIQNSTATAGRSFIATNDREQGVATLAHQMADAMGLRHANALESGSGIIRTMPDDDSWYNCRGEPSCIEARNDYLIDSGNVFDVMGTASRTNTTAEMNLLYKSYFGWVDLHTDVPLVTASGRYRIYAFDRGEKSDGPIGLRFQSGNGKYTYWLEYRTTEPYADNNKQGVLVNLEGYAQNDEDPQFWKTTSYLLDMTPESKNATQPHWWGNDYTDAALGLGRDFEDQWGAFKIRPYQVGGKEDSANAWIEVDVVTKADGLAFPGDLNGVSSSTPELITKEVGRTTVPLPTSTTAPTISSTRGASSEPTSPGTMSASTAPTASTTSITTTAPATGREIETLHDVAVIYLKEQGKEPQFDIDTLHGRIRHQVDSLIRSNSYQKEGFGRVGKFGWYDIASEQWNAALSSRSWTALEPIVRAKRSGIFDLSHHDYVLSVWDDPRQVIPLRGEAYPNKRDIVIDGTVYRRKSEMAKYLKPDDLQNHCFYKGQIRGRPELCYTNPVGDNLKKFEGVIFHEFLHTKSLAHHSLTKYCENILLGRCGLDLYNMFDALSSARFYGNSLNAFDKHRINWLTDDDIISLEPDSGHHEITLHHLSSQDNGKKAVKIAYQAVMGSDIWLEYRRPTKLDYGLFNPVFDKVTNGLLVLQNNRLLDATPETQARNFVEQTDVSITDRLRFDPLGLNIDIIDVDSNAGAIQFRVNLTAIQPTRNLPVIKDSQCNGQGDCRVPKGGAFKAYYEAKLSDIGYGSQLNKAWVYRLTGLPTGIRWVDDGIKRQFTEFPGAYTSAPHTYITFSADATAQPGTYRFTMRFIHPDDQSKYVDLSQFLTVVE